MGTSSNDDSTQHPSHPPPLASPAYLATRFAAAAEAVGSTRASAASVTAPSVTKSTRRAASDTMSCGTLRRRAGPQA